MNPKPVVMLIGLYLIFCTEHPFAGFFLLLAGANI